MSQLSWLTCLLQRCMHAQPPRVSCAVRAAPAAERARASANAPDLVAALHRLVQREDAGLVIGLLGDHAVAVGVRDLRGISGQDVSMWQRGTQCGRMHLHGCGALTGPRALMQAHARSCRPMCSRTQPHDGTCSPVRGHAAACSPMRTHAAPCSPPSNPMRPPCNAHAAPCGPLPTHRDAGAAPGQRRHVGGLRQDRRADLVAQRRHRGTGRAQEADAARRQRLGQLRVLTRVAPGQLGGVWVFIGESGQGR